MNINITSSRAVISCLLSLCSIYLSAQQEGDSLPRLGSSDQVDNIIEIDKSVSDPFFEFTFLGPYYNFKEGIKTSSGLNFATEYSSLFIGTNSDVGEGSANSGIWKFYGSWDLVGKKSGNSGAFVFKVEHRHQYSEIPPKSLGLDMGYVGFISAPFSNEGWRATNFYFAKRCRRFCCTRTSRAWRNGNSPSKS